MRALLACGSMILALTACTGSKDEAQTAEGDTKAVLASKAEPMRVKPGLWETKITFTSIEAKGLPEAARTQMLKAMGNGVTIKSCLTKEQADKPGAEFFGSAKDSNCSVNMMEIKGGSATVAMTCKPDAKTVIQSKMSGQYSENSYAMNVTQTTTGTPMGDLVTAGRVEGKWLSECTAEKGK